MLRCYKNLTAVVLLCGYGLPLVLAEDKKEPPKLVLSEEEQAILDLTNKAREKEKLAPLKPHPVLFAVARAHSANMAKQREMKHDLDGKNPAQRVKAAGYDYSWVGENIAMTEGDTPAGIFKDWMESKIHRENILKDVYQEIGIGVAKNDKGEVYYTQVFAAPRKAR